MLSGLPAPPFNQEAFNKPLFLVQKIRCYVSWILRKSIAFAKINAEKNANRPDARELMNIVMYQGF